MMPWDAPGPSLDFGQRSVWIRPSLGLGMRRQLQYQAGWHD